METEKSQENLGVKVYEFSLDNGEVILKIQMFRPQPKLKLLLAVVTVTLYGSLENMLSQKRWQGTEIRRELTASYAITWINEYLPDLLELTFRDSHHNVGSLVKQAVQKHMTHISRGMKIRLLEHELIEP